MPGPQCAEKNQYQDSRTGGRTETGLIRAGTQQRKKSIKMVDRASKNLIFFEGKILFRKNN